MRGVYQLDCCLAFSSGLEQGGAAFAWPLPYDRHRICSPAVPEAAAHGRIRGVPPVILACVKTAVSVPDDLYSRAERVAQRLGRSRSALYAEALEAYLEQVEDQPDEVTTALDRLYATDLATRAAGAVTARRLIDAGDWEW